MKYERTSKWFVVGLALIALIGAAVTADASSLTIPNQFSAGGSISSSSVNQDFSAVANSVNDNNGRIGSLESKLTGVMYYSIPLWGMSASPWGNFQGAWSATAGLTYSSGTNYFDIPVNLPNGVTITELVSYVYDADATYSVSVAFYGSLLNSAYLSSTIASQNSGGAFASGATTLTTTTNSVVNNASYGYSIRITLPVANTIGIFGIRIKYTR